MFADVFNAIVGFYLIVLGASAAAGVRETLRNPGADPPAGAGGAGTPGGALAASPSARSRFGVLVNGRTVHATHRFGWATGVGFALGWASGIEMYRAGRRASIAAARRVHDWREARRAAGARPAELPDPAAPQPGGRGPADGGAPAAPHQPPAAPVRDREPSAPPPPGDHPRDEDWDDPDLDGPGSTPPADTPPALTAAPIASATGRPRHLVLVPPPQEYPDTMAAADIYDLESLVNFTGQAAQVAGMEAEDAAAAAASMIAGAEFAGETATRVAEETASLEAAVAAMAMLRVDRESTAAYHALLEAGAHYRDTTATFSQQCHDAAYTAGQMSAAAAHYNETAAHALAVLNAHQMPHAEAASATGHSGAHGAFYGVADTGGQGALAASGAPQLPAS